MRDPYAVQSRRQNGAHFFVQRDGFRTVSGCGWKSHLLVNGIKNEYGKR
jgi:hypothetical protein